MEVIKNICSFFSLIFTTLFNFVYFAKDGIMTIVRLIQKVFLDSSSNSFTSVIAGIIIFSIFSGLVFFAVSFLFKKVQN